jgi:hypothetical protein
MGNDFSETLALLAALRAKVLAKFSVIPRVAASTLPCAMPYPGLISSTRFGVVSKPRFER